MELEKANTGIHKVLWSLENNVLFLQQPKTGTTSLRAYFKDRSPVGRNYNHKWCHYGLRELARGIEDDDYNMFIERMGKPPLEFNLYAFYRDPIGRYISAACYAREQYKFSFEGVPNADPKMWSDAQNNFRYLLSDESFDVLNMSNDDFLRALLKVYSFDDMPITPEIWHEKRAGLEGARGPNFAMWEFFSPQYLWYVDDRVNLLPFHDYKNSFNYMCDLLELPRTKHIENRNRSLRRLKNEGISEETREQLKLFYKQDYEYFASKGISFDK